MSTRLCPECGDEFSFDDRRRGPNPTYCTRRCQVRNLNRRRAAGPSVTIRMGEETRQVLDHAAERHLVSTQRYIELLIDEHVDHLLDTNVRAGGG